MNSRILDVAGPASAIATRFVAARRSGASLPAYPGSIPPGLDAAYAVQDAAIALMPSAVAGWKVGRVGEPWASQLGVGRLAGPIFAPSIQHDSGTAVGRVFVGGFAAAEAEFLLRLGTTPPAGQRRYSLEQAAALVGAVHFGIEIASSPLATINDLGPPVIISDFGNNNGLIVGPEARDWQTLDLLHCPVETFVDGVRAGAGTAAAFSDGLLGSVRFMLELAAARGIALPAGTWISSGAVSGVHEVRPGQRVEARFGTLASVRCVIESMPHG